MGAIEIPQRIIWEPQAKQRHLITCPFDDVMFGGSRGGGKTDGALGDWLSHSSPDEASDKAVGIVFRREGVQLEEMIQRAQAIYLPVGAKWLQQQRTFVMPSRARLKFRHLERDEQAQAYQGHSYTRVYFEELTNFPDPAPVDKMWGVLRSGHGVPCKMRSTANPGGPGHQWVKARYITPAPLGYKPLTIEIPLPDGRKLYKSRCFIPSKVQDNTFLGDDYVAGLHLVGSASLVRAWLAGDWDIVEGAFFDCWRGDIVLAPFAIPRDWTRFRSFDWGYARPFSVGWWAVASGDPVPTPDGGVIILPRGALVRYREFYGAERDPITGLAKPNVGARMEVEDMLDEIAGMEEFWETEAIQHSVADPAIFDGSRGPSIAERFMRHVPKAWKKEKRTFGIQWSPAENKRMPGWSQMRQRMIGFDGTPMMYVFATCVDFIRTVPALQHDKKNPEDLDTEGEDHAADDGRYACMSRPMPKEKPRIPNVPKVGTFDWLDWLEKRKQPGHDPRLYR